MLLIEGLFSSGYHKRLRNTLLIPVPISYSRSVERGFNQTELIVNRVCQKFGCEKNYDFIKCENTQQHMAGKSKEERATRAFNPFFIDQRFDVSKYTNITILDDVITTGKTLENMVQVIKGTYSNKLEVNAICLFRGKPYYL
jgi:predicted amidophosphoribosyltransferase